MARDAELKVTVRAEDKASRQMDQFTNGLKKNMGTFAKYVLVYQTGFAVLNAFTRSLKKSTTSVLDFERALAKSSTIAGQFAGNMEDAETAITNLSTKFGTDAVEATEAFYTTLSAGFKENPLEILRASQDAAVAGNVKLSESTEAITGALNIFGDEVQDLTKLNDIFFNMVDQGRLTFNQIPDALGKTGQTAKNMGVSIGELGGVLAQSTKTTNSLNKSSTQVRSALTALLKPGSQMKTVFKSLNVETGQQLVKEKGLLGAFQAVRSASQILGLSLGDVLGRKEALNAVLTTTNESLDEEDGNLQKTAATIERVSEVSGTTAQAVKKLMATTSKRLEIFGQKILELGRIFVGPFLKGFLDMADEVKKGLEDNLLIGFHDLRMGVLRVSKAIIILGKGFKSAFKFFGAVLGQGLGALIEIFEKLSKGDFSGAFDAIKRAGSGMGEVLDKELLEIGKKVDDLMRGKIPKLTKNAVDKTQGALKNAGKGMASNIVSGLVGNIDPTAAKKLGKDPAKALRDLVKNFERQAGKKVSQTEMKIGSSLSLDFHFIVDEVEQALSKASKKVLKNKEGAFNDLKDAIAQGQLKINTVINDAIKKHNEMLNMAGTVSTAFSNVAGALGGVVSEVERFNASLAKGLGIIQKVLTIVSQIKAIEQAITSYKEAQNQADALGKVSAIGGGIASGLGIFGTIASFFHKGGPIQRLHNGGVPNRLSAGEVPIIAQTGEYMLSRRAVQNMGGTEAVDDMHRNAQAGGAGGGTNVHLNLAFDPDNFRSFITGTAEGRDIIKNAVIGAFPS
mgnify:CR=1 FL=1